MKKKGEMKRGNILLFATLLGIVVVSATVFAVTGTGTVQNEVYLVPQHGNAALCGTAEVEIWIDAENFQGGQLNLTYDSNCVNLTDWERNTTAFPMGGWDSSIEGKEWITLLAYSSMTGNYKAGTVTIQCVSEDACATLLNFTSPSALFDPNGDRITVNWVNGTFTCVPTGVLDTGPGTYPSISGTHKGTIKPNVTIKVSTLYTYPCPGTGGHTEFVGIWNSSWPGVEAHWNGYKGDWHNISFNPSFTLIANETYYYTIITGSYPQIHHKSELPITTGWINCTNFTDANGRVYYDWIPAIRLIGCVTPVTAADVVVTRCLPDEPVGPKPEVITVTLTQSGFFQIGDVGWVNETLPEGFTYVVGSVVDGDSYTVVIDEDYMETTDKITIPFGYHSSENTTTMTYKVEADTAEHIREAEFAGTWKTPSSLNPLEYQTGEVTGDTKLTLAE